ncbi:MAG: helix-turn-helix domain-containing protein [Edaphobacter sp.]
MSELKKPPERASLEDAERYSRADFSGNGFAQNVSQGARESHSITPEKVLNLQEAAAILRCHPKTLRLMAKAQKIPARRVGRLWRFSEDRLRDWMEAS